MSGASLPVPLGDLPGYVRDDICVVLDSSAEHNWVKLIEKIPDHGTYRDLLELRSLADRVSFSVMLLGSYLFKCFTCIPEIIWFIWSICCHVQLILLHCGVKK